MDFRTKMKQKIASQILEIPTETKEEALEKHELSLRLFQFFEYLTNPYTCSRYRVLPNVLLKGKCSD